MVFSPTASVMLAAQALCGLAGAALVPTLVVLIANHFRGEQQAKALGWLGSARAMAGVLAFLIIGTLERFVSWRAAFGLLIVHAIAILIMSFKLKPSTSRPEVKIDIFGVILISSAVILLSFGFNNLRTFGLFMARPAAPFDILGISPAPMMIVVGLMLASAFLVWTRKREAAKKMPLFALEVVDSAKERATVLMMFLIVGMEAATNFSVPLYIQIVQGRDAFQTAIAMMPFNLSVFFTAILIVKLYKRFTPRQIASYAFTVVAAGAFWLAFVVSNNWSTIPVLFGLVAFGIGQGALVTLLFNVLVTSSPKELSGGCRRVARHRWQPRGFRGHRPHGHAHGGGAERGRPQQPDREPDHYGRTEGAGGSRQHQFPQQCPAGRAFEAHHRHARTGHRGVADQRGVPSPCAQDRLFCAGRRVSAGDFPGAQSAELQAWRRAWRFEDQEGLSPPTNNSRPSLTGQTLLILPTSREEPVHETDTIARTPQAGDQPGRNRGPDGSKIGEFRTAWGWALAVVRHRLAGPGRGAGDGGTGHQCAVPVIADLGAGC